jgi:hypothetical protein
MKILPVLALLILTGCGALQGEIVLPGHDDRVGVKQSRGNPEDVYTYDSGDYWSESWWYWSQGINYDFVKSKRREGDGVIFQQKIYIDIIINSTFTFSPFLNASDLDKELIKTLK